MSVRAGQIIIDANGFIVDRIQSGGPTNLNIPTEQIKEVGNFHVVGVIRDIPDLTFSVASLDVSTDIEAIMLGLDPSTVTTGPGGTALDFGNSVPLDVLSPFRSAFNKYNIVRGLIIPHLSLESVAYKFGVRANAEETFTLRGDSIYYVPGVPYRDVVPAGTLNGGGTYSFASGPALQFVERGQNVYALSVEWVDFTTGKSKRLFHGPNFDYTDTAGGITINASVVIPATATVYVSYGSLTPSTFNASAPLTASTAVKPAAVRSQDIDVFLSTPGATPTLFRLSGVQNFDCTRKVTLQNDEEFGNSHYTASDYDTADVSGTVGFKGADPVDLFNKISEFAGVPSGQVSGPLTSPPLQLEARIYNHATGAIIKTIYIPDATFSAPALNTQVNQQVTNSFTFTSDTGQIYVFKGAR